MTRRVPNTPPTKPHIALREVKGVTRWNVSRRKMCNDDNFSKALAYAGERNKAEGRAEHYG